MWAKSPTSLMRVSRVRYARNTFQKGVCYLVGSRVSIKIWEDPWIPSIENFSLCAIGNINPSPNWIVDLMTDDKLNWDINKLNNLFDPSTVQVILKIHLSPAHTQDKIIWAPNKSGEFWSNQPTYNLKC